MSNAAIATSAPRVSRPGPIVSAARRAVLARLSELDGGEIRLLDRATGTTHVAGRPGDLSARIVIEDPRTYTQIASKGTLGAAEAYLEGWWTSDDLTAALRIFVRGLATTDQLERESSWWRRVGARVNHALRRNDRAGSRRNISDHYDLGNDFFKLVLDETMTYSCGVFPRRGASLREASEAKLARLCEELDLGPDDHLLEIGTGWGSCAIHAAKNYGCRVTTTTISDQQYEYARQRFQEEGVADQITLLKKDYRNLTGKFDKLVTIEMIEAVGHQYFDTFFEKCDQLLKADGEMLMQAITIVDHRFEHHKKTVDFIKQYIFPGGCLPSVTALSQSMARQSRLRLVHMEDFASHYAETLRRWRNDFLENLNEVRRLGFDDRFIRIWDYYLCYCEAAFMERHVNVTQLWFANHAAKASPVDRNIHSVPQRKVEQTRQRQTETQKECTHDDSQSVGTSEVAV